MKSTKTKICFLLSSNMSKFLFFISLLFFSQVNLAQEKPNVLFLVIDDLNDWIDISKKFPGVKTPNLDKLASKGTYFTKAYSQAPLCGPSRACFLSGLSPAKTGVYLQIKDSDLKKYYDEQFKVDFLPNYFSKQGYKTLGVGKIFHNGEGINAFDEYGGKFEVYGPSPAKRINFPCNFKFLNEKMAAKRSVAITAVKRYRGWCAWTIESAVSSLSKIPKALKT